MAIIRFKRTASKCSQCPFRDRNKVWSRCDVDSPLVAVLGEAPGADEDDAESRLPNETELEFRQKEKGPFVGAAGRMFKYACGQAGLMWHTIWKLNVICCRPADNDISSDEALEAIECCRPGFEQELEYLKKLKVRVIVPVGNTAMNALGIEGKISTCRGSVYPLTKDLVAVPTYHPSYIIRGAIKEEPVWIADLHKAFELTLKKYKAPKERFNIYPSLKDVETFAKDAVADKTMLYVDIEHHGGFNPDWNKITMIGFGTSGEDVLVVPFTKNGKFDYWSPADELRVWKAIRSMLANCPTVYQHALHDVYQLEMKGHKVGNVAGDTLLAHHAVHPELPHGLEYIVSVYGQTPAWKDMMRGAKTHMIDQPDDQTRTYNARDTAVLAQILPPLIKDLKAEGTERTYFDISMKLVRPFVEMMKNGIKVDPERLKALKRNLLTKETKILKRIYAECGLHPSFNLDSPEQVQYLLYGKVPNSYAKAKAECAEIEAKGRSRTTKKYLEACEKIARIDGTKPLYKTRSMVANTDEEALLSIKQQALNRLSAIDCLTRKNASQKQEEQDIERLLHFIDLFLEWSGISKQVSTYTKYPVLRDGRVHTSLGIHGTATGRPNSRDPNLLNVPKDVRSIFVPEKGNCFIQGDYKNLEVFVLGFLTEEPFILKAFAEGISLHDMNAQILFGVKPVKEGEKGYEEYQKFRQAAKKFAFGLNYGGGLQGIYRKILLEVPDFKLSFAAFTQCYNDYFRKLPKYAEWRKLVQDTVTGRSKEELSWVGYRWIRNAFGRKRLFLGSIDEIEREALNTPIQGTAADVTNPAIIEFYALTQKPKYKAMNIKLLLTVYDSILVECPIKHKLEVAQLLKDTMEKDCVINGKKRHFMADIEASDVSWGEMTKLKLKSKGK